MKYEGAKHKHREYSLKGTVSAMLASWHSKSLEPLAQFCGF